MAEKIIAEGTVLLLAKALAWFFSYRVKTEEELGAYMQKIMIDQPKPEFIKSLYENYGREVAEHLAGKDNAEWKIGDA